MVLASDLQCNPVHGVTNEDRSVFGNILAGAALAAAAANAYKAFDIAYTEWKMAKKYWRIAENWMDYYKDYYAPVENQEIDEAMDLPIAEPHYDAAIARARASAWITFKGKLRDSMRCTSKYCTGLRADMLAQIAMAQGVAVSAAEGLGYRNERAYTETRNDVRWQKRLNTAMRGRDIAGEVTSLGAAAAGIYGSLLDQTWQGLVGAGQYLGYSDHRLPTGYPTTYLEGQALYTESGQFNSDGVQRMTKVLRAE